jgi:hypothetical protein
MLHSLYRVYLYGIIVILLYFTATVTTLFLAVLLQATPLNGTQPSTPSSSQLVQTAVFTIISWIFTLCVGGLHYWLLRRNETIDASSANGAVRAVFLNLSEGIAAFIAVLSGVIGINILFQNSGAAGAFATLFVFTTLFLLFEIERRRMPAKAGAAREFQWLHLSGLQLIFLGFFVVPALLNALSASLYPILSSSGVVSACDATSTQPYCYNSLINTSLFGLWLGVGLVVLAWLVYTVLGQAAASPNLVKVMHFLGLAIGVVLVLVALERALELVARIVLGVGATGADLLQSYDFISPLTTGLLIVGAYSVVLSGDRTTVPERSGMTLLTALALVVVLTALTFWVGCATVLDELLQRLAQAGSNSSLAAGLGLIAAGVMYIPLELWLRARTRREGASSAPKRAVELALLAVGMLAAVISLITLLYATLTAILGNPFDQWQQVARGAGSILAIGIVLILVYGRQVLVPRGFRLEPKRPVKPDAGEPVAAGAVEHILDELLAGSITREQAAQRIRSL